MSSIEPLQLVIRVVQNRRAGEKVALGQDKQKKLPFKIMFVSCLSSPSATFALQDPFLEGPYNKRARTAVVVYMQDRGFNSFASNMIRLSVVIK